MNVFEANLIPFRSSRYEESINFGSFGARTIVI
jgi:hypothetical protein